MEEHTKEIIEKGEGLFFEFEQKTLQLSAISKSDDFNWHKSLSKVRECPLVIDNQIQPNTHLEHCGSILKPLCVDMRSHMMQCQEWLEVLRPKVDNGDNTGTDVQATLQEMAIVAENFAVAFFEFIISLAMDRSSQILSLGGKRRFPRLLPMTGRKWPKDGKIMEERIRSLDEDRFMNMISGVETMHYRYLKIHLFISKNYETITKPKSENITDMLM